MGVVCLTCFEGFDVSKLAFLNGPYLQTAETDGWFHFGQMKNYSDSFVFHGIYASLTG